MYFRKILKCQNAALMPASFKNHVLSTTCLPRNFQISFTLAPIEIRSRLVMLIIIMWLITMYCVHCQKLRGYLSFIRTVSMEKVGYKSLTIYFSASRRSLTYFWSVSLVFLLLHIRLSCVNLLSLSLLCTIRQISEWQVFGTTP
jgi:hypothetical protein